jgi:hypothetical protein
MLSTYLTISTRNPPDETTEKQPPRTYPPQKSHPPGIYTHRCSPDSFMRRPPNDTMISTRGDVSRPPTALPGSILNTFPYITYSYWSRAVFYSRQGTKCRRTIRRPKPCVCICDVAIRLRTTTMRHCPPAAPPLHDLPAPCRGCTRRYRPCPRMASCVPPTDNTPSRTDQPPWLNSRRGAKISGCRARLTLAAPSGSYPQV